MKNKNIKEMTETESHLYKRIYFIKTEAKDLYFEENEDEPRSVSVEFKKPRQIQMDYEGTTNIRHVGNPYEALGLMAQLTKGNMFQRLIEKLREKPDFQIDDGLEVDLDTHSFYIVGFDNKEEVIGLTEKMMGRWLMNLRKISEKIKGKMTTEGDEAVGDDYVDMDRGV